MYLKPLVLKVTEADALTIVKWNYLSLSDVMQCSNCLSIFAEIKWIAFCAYIVRPLLPILQSLLHIDRRERAKIAFL